MSAASAPVQVFCGSRMPIRLVYEEEAVAPPGRPAPAEQAIAFDAAARVADPRDNCAIATRDLPGGALLSGGGAGPGSSLRLSVSILEGHRFALVAIAAHDLLLSWGEPFGRALRAIAPGEWLCNAKTLHELRKRQVGMTLALSLSLSLSLSLAGTATPTRSARRSRVSPTLPTTLSRHRSTEAASSQASSGPSPSPSPHTLAVALALTP